MEKSYSWNYAKLHHVTIKWKQEISHAIATNCSSSILSNINPVRLLCSTILIIYDSFPTEHNLLLAKIFSHKRRKIPCHTIKNTFSENFFLSLHFEWKRKGKIHEGSQGSICRWSNRSEIEIDLTRCTWKNSGSFRISMSGRKSGRKFV